MKLKNKLKDALSNIGTALKNIASTNISSPIAAVAIVAAVGFVFVKVISGLYVRTAPTLDTDVTVTTVAASASAAQTNNDGNSSMTRFTIPSGRTVILSGEVGEGARAVAKKIAQLAETDNTKPIWVLINSPGGSVLDGILVVQAMEASKAPVMTVCTQICASMAAMIFEYGTKRYLANRAMLMFHPASGSAQGEIDQMVSRLSFFQSLIGDIESYIAKKVGISLDTYKAQSGNEIWVHGSGALARNYADYLVMLEGADVFSEQLSFEYHNSKSGAKKPKDNKQPIITWEVWGE